MSWCDTLFVCIITYKIVFVKNRTYVKKINKQKTFVLCNPTKVINLC